MPSANKTIRGGIRVLLFDGEHSTRSGVISPLETLRIVMHRIAYDTAGIESDGSASEGSTETNSIQPTEALPCNYFDFIIGSGDGGWVATMLGRLGMSVSQTIEAYQRIHSELHHSNQSLSTKERTSRFKDMLKELVKSHSVSSNTEESFRITSKDMRCRTILLAMTSQSIGSPTLIRSYNSREFPFENCTTVAAILAATAVPGLFEPWKIGYQKFIAANQWGHCNPLSATLSEVKTVFPNDSLFCILSLGSGHPGHNSLPEAETPAITATALRLAKDAEAGAQQAQSQLNTKEKILFRFNVEQGLQEYVKADKEGYDDAFCHTQAYCQHPEVTAAIDAAVKRLLQSTADEPLDTPSVIIPRQMISTIPKPPQIIHLNVTESSMEPIQTYINELYNLKHGLPLWDPQPRLKVVEIGDVGFVDDDGNFKTLFNATVDADKQPDFAVPPDFVSLKIRSDNIETVREAIRYPYLYHGAMSAVDIGLTHDGKSLSQDYRLTFDIVRGAVLVLKDLPTSIILPPSERVRNHIMDHQAQWYDFCQDPDGLDRDLKGHELIFVTGVYRNRDWTLGAWPKQCSCSHFGVATFHNGKPSKLSGTWNVAVSHEIQDGPSSARPKPSRSPVHPQLETDMEEQCLFIRGYKIGRRELRVFPDAMLPSVPDPKKMSWLEWMKLKAAHLGIPSSMSAAAEPQDLPPPSPPPMSDPVLAQDADNSSPLSVVELEGRQPLQHPLDNLINLIFELRPNAESAIVHDGDWEDLERCYTTELKSTAQSSDTWPFNVEEFEHCAFIQFPTKEPSNVPAEVDAKATGFLETPLMLTKDHKNLQGTRSYSTWGRSVARGLVNVEKAIVALAFDGSSNSLNGLTDLYILQEVASRWAFDSEEDLRGDEVRPKDMFDIIGGTGIGGFYAILFTRLNLTIGQAMQAHRILEERLFVTEVWMSKNQNARAEILHATTEEIAKELELEISLDSPFEEKDPPSKGFVCVVDASASSNCRLLRNYRTRTSHALSCSIRQALQASLSDYAQLPAIQIEEEILQSAQGMFTHPTRILMNELQHVFPRGSQIACLVSIDAGYSQAYPSMSGGASVDNPTSIQIPADELTSLCREIDHFFFRFSLPSSFPRLTNLKETVSQLTSLDETYSQLKGATMAYLHSHSVSTMLDGLVQSLIERRPVVSLKRLESLAGKDGQSQSIARIHQVQQHLDDSLFRDINKWLQPIQQNSKLDANIRDRGENTCQWILENPTFKQWKKAKGGIFWYHGLMCTSKTMTMSFITHGLLADPNIQVAYYYFEFANPSTLSEDALLRSVFAQLSPGGPEVARVLFRRYKRGALQPQLAALQTALSDLVSTASRPVFLVIDALDELPQSQRESLLQWLLVFHESANHTHVMVTSRKEPDIYHALDDKVDFQLDIPHDCIRQDMATFVDQQLAVDRWSLWPCEDIEMIRKVLNTQTSYPFLTVTSQLEVLQRAKTSNQLRECLHSLPKTLSDTYEYILNRIPQNTRSPAHTLFSLLSFTDQPISVAEISALMAVDFGDPDDVDHLPRISRENCFHDPLGLLDLGRSLVSQTSHSKQGTCIQFAHSSLKEYLLQDLGRWFSLKEGPAHIQIASACLAILDNFEVLSRADGATPFVYSRDNWFNHIFPSSPPVLLRQQQVLYASFPWSKAPFFHFGYMAQNPLTSAASLGLLDLIEHFLVTRTWEAHVLGTALVAAAQSTQRVPHGIQCCRLLIMHGANVNYCRGGMNALLAASRCGNVGVVQMLVNKGADINMVAGEHGTTLQAAVSGGDFETVRYLVEKGADINMPSKRYGTSLQVAASSGNLKMVQYLVGEGADVNAPGGKYGSALNAATQYGWAKIGKFLIEQGGAVVNKVTGTEETSLQIAASSGDLEIVRLLLDYGADVDPVGRGEMSALQAAASSGHIEIVRRLVASGADVNLRSGKERTALSAAASSGNVEIVKYLVEKGADVNLRAGEEGTALRAAASGGNAEIVEYLVEKGADVNLCAGGNGTALHAAASNGNAEIVKYLVEKGADVNARGGNDETTLQAAASNGNFRTVRFLVEEGADVNAWGGTHSTALQAALSSRDFDSVHFLVKNGADVNGVEGMYGTVLREAVSSGNVEIIRFWKRMIK